MQPVSHLRSTSLIALAEAPPFRLYDGRGVHVRGAAGVDLTCAAQPSQHLAPQVLLLRRLARGH